MPGFPGPFLFPNLHGAQKSLALTYFPLHSFRTVGLMERGDLDAIRKGK